MTRITLSLPLAALLAACVSQPATEEPPVPAAVSALAPAEEVALPERPFPPESVYPLLKAEFALRRRDYESALDTYLDQSQSLRDPGVARHTAHLAQFMRDEQRALQAVQLWLELEPDNVEANNGAATLLARQRRPLEALPHMVLVARSGVQANFPLLLQGFGDLPDAEQAQLVKGLNDLHAEFPEDPALLLTQALIHTEFRQYDQALAKLDILLAQEPEQHQALLLEARVKLENGDPKPFTRIDDALDENPEDSRLRLEYAKLLTTTDMAAARKQFEILSAQSPRDADLLLSLALINSESGEPLVARAYLKQMLELGKRTDEAHYYLGMIAEERKETELAISHYQQVGDSRQYMAANQRIGELLAEAQQLERYGAWFAAQRAAQPMRAEQLYGLEADILSRSGYLQDSRATLDAGVTAFPDSSSLRYARAMLAEQQGQLDQLENDLRAILASDPENATALNALGYTLANRTERYDEAYALISRALALEPDEPAILDSMGWVLFHKGRLDESLEYLNRAYAVFPDPEVAAHLGEVLWTMGRTEQALRVWRGALAQSPGHDIVLDTLRRLGVEDMAATPLPAELPGAP
jgi:tetratricopeptide (TPR) repeat protein